MYTKTTRFGFQDIQINQGVGKGYQPKPQTLAYNPYIDLAHSGYHKNIAQQLKINSY